MASRPPIATDAAFAIGMSSTRTTARLPIYAGLTVACLLWTWYAGRDVNWDLFNYHVYAGHLALQPERLWQDYFAASIQSYLNPYAYVPFYLLVEAPWPGIAVGLAMACLHSVNLWLVYEIARVIVPTDRENSRLPVFGAVLIAALSPLFLQQVGTSYADVLTATPVLAGFLLLARAYASGTGAWPWILLAGLLMGLASGLKMTNAVLAAGAAAFVLATRARAGESIVALLAYGVGGAIGLASSSGAWFLAVWERFGNPIFPLMNGLFRSPDYPPVNFRHERFATEGVVDVLSLPFRMLAPTARIYVEESAPDARFLFLLVMVAALIVLALRRRFGDAERLADVGGANGGSRDGQEIGKSYLVVLVSFAGAFLLWSLYSANGRYMLPLTLLVGPLCVGTLLRAITSSRGRVFAVVTLLVLHLPGLLLATPPRFVHAPWEGSWIDVEVPANLKARPYVFASITPQSASFLVSRVHADSRFVNLVGQYTLPHDALERVATSRGHGAAMAVRSLGLVASYDHTLRPHADEFKQHDARLAPYGLRLDPNDCEVLVLKTGLGGHVHDRTQPGTYRVTATPGITKYLTCATLPRPTAPSLRDALASADAFFTRVESTCPRLFRPQGTTIADPGSFSRFYAATDTLITLKDGQVLFGPDWKRPAQLPLGPAKTIEGGLAALPECR